MSYRSTSKTHIYYKSIKLASEMYNLFIFGCYSFDLADQHCEQLARTAIVAVMAVKSFAEGSGEDRATVSSLTMLIWLL